MAGASLYAYNQNGGLAVRQLRSLSLFQGKDEEAVEEFLLSEQISSLNDLNMDDLYSYRDFVSRMDLSPIEKLHYGALLESVALAFFRESYAALCGIIDTGLSASRAGANKVKMFLMLEGIQSADEITYYHRRDFEKYLSFCGCSQRGSYVKLLDRLKLSAIEKENAEPFRRLKKLTYADQVVYLGYHPDIAVAREFYYTQNKDELVFDFSLSAAGKLKRQVFSMLCHVLEKEMKPKNRREMYLVPLKKLYLYCAEENIEDLEALTREQIEGFRQSMDGKVGTKTDIYMQIVYSVRKHLFLSAPETNWDANAWFLDRFVFKNDRINPANYIECFRFDQIKNNRNRSLLKAYMRNQIGISSRALQTILSHYSDIVPFLKYCDGTDTDCTKILPEQVDAYFSMVDAKDIREETFNKVVMSLDDFYRYLVSRGEIGKVPFERSYYRKKCLYVHHDRSVDKEDQISLLTNLKHFPEDLRLMCINIWSTGIRVNEVCTIRGNAYTFDGEDAYLTLTQYKMVSEKKIPIPKIVYLLMKEYIRKNGIGPDEYVFKSKKGKAYQASTFRVQVQRLCRKYNIGNPDYIFRPHDFRHDVGTELFDAGTPLQAIRDYLGHRDQEMTKQYVDYMPRKVHQANKSYFVHNSLLKKDDDKNV